MLGPTWSPRRFQAGEVRPRERGSPLAHHLLFLKPLFLPLTPPPQDWADGHHVALLPSPLAQRARLLGSREPSSLLPPPLGQGTKLCPKELIPNCMAPLEVAGQSKQSPSDRREQWGSRCEVQSLPGTCESEGAPGPQPTLPLRGQGPEDLHIWGQPCPVPCPGRTQGDMIL